jgi:hypothetical protein
MAFETHGPEAAPFDRPTSPVGRIAAWIRARLDDMRDVAEVLHEHQWSSPWDQPSPRPAEPKRGRD